MQKPPTHFTHLSTQVGLILWRLGAYFCAGYLAYRGVMRLLNLLLAVDIPTKIIVSLALSISGLLFIFASLILERIQDARNERSLRD
ncbi:MAG: hypothetical protein P8H65_11455 [Rhodothermales bacterium]|nr:hypothetical protein [Rhodothermales bacterium]HAY37298.1 hypothetical protein [Bacteroidota bacterium]